MPVTNQLQEKAIVKIFPLKLHLRKYKRDTL